MTNILVTPQWITTNTPENHLLEGYDGNGSDLIIETFEPDDIVMLRERIAYNKERLDVADALIVAEETLLAIMEEFFGEGEDFRIHEDDELQNFVKDCIRHEIFAQLGDGTNVPTISDDWLNTRLNNIRGFPPHSYRDDSAEVVQVQRPTLTEVSVAEEVQSREDARIAAMVKEASSGEDNKPTLDPSTLEWLRRKALGHEKL